MAQPLPRGEAEGIAIRALAFLGSDEERLARFLSLSGLDIGHLRRAAAEPHFLREVLAYILQDEPSLLDLASEIDVPPERIVAAARVLGAAHWEE